MRWSGFLRLKNSYERVEGGKLVVKYGFIEIGKIIRQEI